MRVGARSSIVVICLRCKMSSWTLMGYRLGESMKIVILTQFLSSVANYDPAIPFINTIEEYFRSWSYVSMILLEESIWLTNAPDNRSNQKAINIASMAFSCQKQNSKGACTSYWTISTVTYFKYNKSQQFWQEFLMKEIAERKNRSSVRTSPKSNKQNRNGSDGGITSMEGSFINTLNYIIWVVEIFKDGVGGFQDNGQWQSCSDARCEISGLLHCFKQYNRKQPPVCRRLIPSDIRRRAVIVKAYTEQTTLTEVYYARALQLNKLLCRNVYEK